MIFDYEKLNRVLEEEKRYFKEVSSVEQKSHQERLSELESMRGRLLKEESSGTENLKLCKLRLGILRINDFTSKRIYDYR